MLSLGMRLVGCGYRLGLFDDSFTYCRNVEMSSKVCQFTVVGYRFKRGHF